MCTLVFVCITKMGAGTRGLKEEATAVEAYSRRAQAKEVLSKHSNWCLWNSGMSSDAACVCACVCVCMYVFVCGACMHAFFFLLGEGGICVYVGLCMCLVCICTCMCTCICKCYE